MKSVEGNSDREKDVEMWRMVDHLDSGEEPLEIFQQEVSVFEKPEHAQVHADAGNQPRATRRSLRLGNLPPQPKIHRGGGKEKRGKGWIPRAVKNITRGHEQIFSRGPGMDAPVRGHDYDEKDDEGEGIKKHERPRWLI